MRKWVTYHGISLNYAVEMERYQAIVQAPDPVIEPPPARHLGRPIDLRGELVPAVVEAFAAAWKRARARPAACRRRRSAA